MYQPVDSSLHAQPALKKGEPLTLKWLVNILRRHWPMILGVWAGVVALTVAYVLVAPASYLASARVLLDLKQATILDRERLMTTTLIDPGFIDSQVEIIKSEDLLATVVRNMKLETDPEFGPREPSGLGRIVGWVKGLFGGSGEKLDPAKVALVGFTNSLKVDRLGNAYVLAVSVRSEDPVKAAKLANAVAQAYLDNGLQAQFQSARRAAQWLQERSLDLRQQATVADQAVQTFKAQNDIVGTSRGLVGEQQLADINAQLVAARATTAEAKARLERIQNVNDRNLTQTTVSDALNNTVITRLRAQYLDLMSRYAYISGEYGAKHQASLNLASKMEEIKKSINDELMRIAEAYKSDYEIAKSRESLLEQEFEKLVQQAGSSNLAHVKLRNLESTADTYRTLYNSFLQKLEQMSQQESFPISDARIIASASAPDKPSSPQGMLLLAAAAVGGLGLGFCIAVVKELTSDGIRTPGECEQTLGVGCLAVLPELRPADLGPGMGQGMGKALPAPLPRGGSPLVKRIAQKEQLLLADPFSAYGERLRELKIGIDFYRTPRTTQVVGLTSALQGEGKTTTAANLAYLTTLTGHRTLLIDADVHSGRLTRSLAGHAKRGLLECLSQGGPVENYICRDLPGGLHVLPAVSTTRVINAPDLLSSRAMQGLLQTLRQQYDYIFLDLPPLGAMTDAKAVSPLVDGLVFVIASVKTPKDIVLDTLLGASFMKDKIIGVVINRADFKTSGLNTQYRIVPTV